VKKLRNEVANKKTLEEKKFIGSEIKNAVPNSQKMHCI
jgi:hypothetical protein